MLRYKCTYYSHQLYYVLISEQYTEECLTAQIRLWTQVGHGTRTQQHCALESSTHPPQTRTLPPPHTPPAMAQRNHCSNCVCLVSLSIKELQFYWFIKIQKFKFLSAVSFFLIIKKLNVSLITPGGSRAHRKTATAWYVVKFWNDEIVYYVTGLVSRCSLGECDSLGLSSEPGKHLLDNIPYFS